LFCISWSDTTGVEGRQAYEVCAGRQSLLTTKQSSGLFTVRVRSRRNSCYPHHKHSTPIEGVLCLFLGRILQESRGGLCGETFPPSLKYSFSLSFRSLPRNLATSVALLLALLYLTILPLPVGQRFLGYARNDKVKSVSLRFFAFVSAKARCAFGTTE
jgi:hypothetical protein